MKAENSSEKQEAIMKGGKSNAMFAVCFMLCFLAAMALAGCASRPVNERITQVDPKAGYRPYLLIPKRKNNDLRTLFVLSFSGGGTRAAAFSYGVLRSCAAPRSCGRPAPPADRRGRPDHRRVGRQLYGAFLRALRRAAVRRVRGALPQARRARVSCSRAR